MSEIKRLRRTTRNNVELRNEIFSQVEEECNEKMHQELSKRQQLLNLNNKKKLEKK